VDPIFDYVLKTEVQANIDTLANYQSRISNSLNKNKNEIK
jgi:hypothetical protein